MFRYEDARYFAASVSAAKFGTEWKGEHEMCQFLKMLRTRGKILIDDRSFLQYFMLIISRYPFDKAGMLEIIYI